jgi:ketosteroid isomerase-like protein
MMPKWTIVVVPLAAMAISAHTDGLRNRQSDEIIAIERAALDRWGRGDPQGFLTTYAPEITYFDPMQDRRVDGLPAMQSLLAPVAGKFTVDRYEMLHPKVQHHGNVAVLTYQLVNYRKLADGTEQPTTRWNSTAVFRKMERKWRTIHSHWSLTRPPLGEPSSP